jgi:excisionase family DNA binding protein
MSRALQFEFPFASLDFPGRTTLSVDEVAERLGVTAQHVLDLIAENLITGIDLKGRAATRRLIRIPIESYRNFVVERMTGPARRDFLRTLPPATLRDLQRELTEILAA